MKQRESRPRMLLSRMGAPGLKELARQPALQHGRRGHDDAGAHTLQRARVGHVLHVLEHKGVGRLRAHRDLRLA